jgi:jumonji domain-containing protein 7
LNVDADHVFYRSELMESTSMVNSPVDIVNPDLEKYPLFATAPALHCTVEEGDALYLVLHTR